MGTASDDLAILISWLREHDEVCPVCRYGLRGVAGARCPECGAALRLSVASPNAALGAWVLGVVSFALALGFDGVTLLLLGSVLTAELVADPQAIVYTAPRVLVFLSPLLVMGLGCLAGLGLLFVRRRAWALMARRRQWVLAIGIFVGVGLVHAGGGALMVFVLSP